MITIQLRMLINEIIKYNENDYLNWNILLIDNKSMKIINKIDYIIYFTKPEKEFHLTLDPDISLDYYLCFIFSSNIINLHSIGINIIFRSKNYIEVINYRHYYDDKRLFEVIKKEFKDSKVNTNSLKYKENVFH